MTAQKKLTKRRRLYAALLFTTFALFFIIAAAQGSRHSLLIRWLLFSIFVAAFISTALFVLGVRCPSCKILLNRNAEGKTLGPFDPVEQYCPSCGSNLETFAARDEQDRAQL